ISLDVNPCIQIEVNRKEKVLDVTPLNEDGRTVVGDMDFTGSSLDITVNALIGSMLQNGYLNDIANSILVSVDSRDRADAAAIQSRLTDEISTLLQTDTFTGAVLSQTIHADSELQELANTYGITTGKAELIRQIITGSGLHTFDELAALSINDLNLLANAGTTKLDTVSSVGEASAKAYIGKEEAVKIVRDHAGAYEITRYECEMDWEGGMMIYEVDLWYDGWEYDYDVDATTGEILRAEKETDGNGKGNVVFGGDKTGAGGTGIPSDGKSILLPEQSGPSDQPIVPMPNVNAAVIGEEAAQKIALEDAGLTAEEIYDYDCELDRDNGKIRYEIDFKADGYEYEYELDAEDGRILHRDKERD
ncbi:MAG: PepSY domain-containing protein, partial [Clostridia bacterium]|nr:PepSY domain-containing protein [Clostridia bacterium]